MLATAAEPLALGSGPIVVIARHPASAAALVDVCRLGGYEPTIVDAASLLTEHGPAPQSPAAAGTERTILWDATPEQVADPAAIRKVREACGSGPVVAVVGFVRPDECRRAAEAGVAAVVTKPYLIHDLLWQLAHLKSAGGV